MYRWLLILFLFPLAAASQPVQDVTLQLRYGVNPTQDIQRAGVAVALIQTETPNDPFTNPVILLEGVTDAAGRLTFQSVATSNEEHSLPESFEVGAPYPNPTTSSTSIPLSVRTSGIVFVKAFDVSGRLVLAQRLSASAGSHRIEISPPFGVSGLLSIRVSKDGNVRHAQVSVVSSHGSGAVRLIGGISQLQRAAKSGSPQWVIVTGHGIGDGMDQMVTDVSNGFSAAVLTGIIKPTELVLESNTISCTRYASCIVDLTGAGSANEIPPNWFSVVADGAEESRISDTSFSMVFSESGTKEVRVRAHNEIFATGDGVWTADVPGGIVITVHVGKVDGSKPASREKVDLYEPLNGTRLVVTDENDRYIIEGTSDESGLVRAFVPLNTTVKLYVFHDQIIPRLHEIYEVGTGFVSTWYLTEDTEFEVYAAAVELPEAWLFRHTFSNGLRPLSRPDPELYPDGILPARIGPGDQIAEDSLVFRQMLQVANEQYAEPLYHFSITCEDQAYATTKYDITHNSAGSTVYNMSDLNTITATTLVYAWPLGTGQLGKTTTSKEIAQSIGRTADFKGNIAGDETVISETPDYINSFWNQSSTSNQINKYDITTNTINGFDIPNIRWELKIGLLQEGYSITDKNAEQNIIWPSGKTAPGSKARK